MTYEKVINYIDSLPRFIPVKTCKGRPLFNLETVTELAKRFDNPQDKIKCVHIAGTNGKGSVTEFLSEILLKSGYKVGTFTSPYLIDIREQTKVDGVMITESEFTEIFIPIIKESEKMYRETGVRPSEFEMDVVASFLHFFNNQCDICIIETGLGGEYDATNIISNPLLCIFTEISKDHMMILGDSLQSISAVKSGIIKEGCLCITGRQTESVMNVLQKKASEMNSVFYIADFPEEQNIGIDGTEFRIKIDGKMEWFETKVTGSYQVENAVLAIAASEELKENGFSNVNIESIRKGLLSTKRPGRFQVIKRDPLIIADGAHNVSGVKVMLDSLKMIFPNRYDSGKGFVFVVGVMEDKEYKIMIEQVVPHAFKIFCVTPKNVRALPALRLSNEFISSGAEAESFENINDALEEAMRTSKNNNMPAIIFGTLYCMGDVLNYFEEK